MTVSLSGDGGDELFCGYNTYYSIDRIWNKARKIPGILRRPASALAGLAAVSGKASLATRARLLGAKSIEDMYLRSEIGEGMRLIKRGITGCDQDFGPWDAMQPRRAGETWMDTYPAGLLEEGQHNLDADGSADVSSGRYLKQSGQNGNGGFSGDEGADAG